MNTVKRAGSLLEMDSDVYYRWWQPVPCCVSCTSFYTLIC